jgi:hypothetical protein
MHPAAPPIGASADPVAQLRCRAKFELRPKPTENAIFWLARLLQKQPVEAEAALLHSINA